MIQFRKNIRPDSIGRCNRDGLWLWVVILLLGSIVSVLARPVEFSFAVPETDGNPFAREVWATVRTPSGAAVRLPAFYLEDDRFCVRVRADEAGSYELQSVEEGKDGSSPIRLPFAGLDPAPAVFEVDVPSGLFPVGIALGDPQSFALKGGAPFVPIGGNLPWPEQGREAKEYYQVRLQEFGQAGLNWARLWMVHWGHMNLDWLNDSSAAQVKPGWLDAGVARNWDALVEMAEENGVYLQIVLQYHGQYSTETNSNWEDNPWNARNPDGFLEKPADFFRSAQARQLTKQKYRTIIARWGYSPAVMAWELFNEVHWVDALRFDLDEALVADWHREMADFIRSVDGYGHLVTTSMDSIRSPIYDAMDYLQPHLYPINIFANVRSIDSVYESLGRPVFVGEFGDDHMGLSEAQKKRAISVVPPMWAGVMGQLHLPPQPWFTDQLIEAGRLDELAALARFLTATRVAEQSETRPFSPAVECTEREPLVVRPGVAWVRGANPVIELAVDGRSPVSEGLLPATLVSDPRGLELGFPSEATFNLDFSRPEKLVLHFRSKPDGVEGTAGEVELDGLLVAKFIWPAQGETTPGGRAVDLAIEVPPGPRTLTVRNAGGPDWFHFDGLDTELDRPVIAAVGRRSDRFIALWIWHREGVHALEPVEAVSSILAINDVAAGSWEVVHWDSVAGVPVGSRMIEHAGGRLDLETPAVSRHAAVVLTLIE